MPKGFPKSKNPELYGSDGQEPTSPPPAELPTITPEGGPKGSGKKRGGITEADTQAFMATFYGLVGLLLRVKPPATKAINEDAAWLYRVITRWPAISVVVIAAAPLALIVRVVSRVSEMLKRKSQGESTDPSADVAQQAAELAAEPPAQMGVVDTMPETAPAEDPILQQAAALAGNSYRSRGGAR